MSCATVGSHLLSRPAQAAGARHTAHAVSPPHVASFSKSEREELRAGQRVEREIEFRFGTNSYVGGVAYQVVRADAAAVLSEVSNVENLRSMLPNTLSARVVSRRAGVVRVQVEQGVQPFVARYTIVMSEGVPGEVRFWLDKSAPHDIEDVWGFFRVTPFEKHSLLTVATAIDLGQGLVGALFRERVRALALRSASSIRDFVEPRCTRWPVASPVASRRPIW